MYKLKKIIFILAVSSPIIFVLIFGYPVNTYREQVKGGLTYTKRCFKVGEWEAFFKCFKTGKQINGGRLITEINTKTASLFPYFNIVFFISLICSLILFLFI